MTNMNLPALVIIVLAIWLLSSRARVHQARDNAPGAANFVLYLFLGIAKDVMRILAGGGPEDQK